MKKISLFLLGLFMLGGVAYAGIGILEDGSYEGETGAINCSTDLDCTQSGNTTTIALESNISQSIIAATYYITAPYYSRLTFPGSGAPVGSIMVKGGASDQDCGTAGNGTTISVCVSNGTNWIPV
jgi:hypothetical protein